MFTEQKGGVKGDCPLNKHEYKEIEKGWEEKEIAPSRKPRCKNGRSNSGGAMNKAFGCYKKKRKGKFLALQCAAKRGTHTLDS